MLRIASAQAGWPYVLGQTAGKGRLASEAVVEGSEQSNHTASSLPRQVDTTGGAHASGKAGAIDVAHPSRALAFFLPLGPIPNQSIQWEESR